MSNMISKGKYIVEGWKISQSRARAAVLRCYPHHCLYCRKSLGSSEVTIDHLIPRSKGGEWTIENMVPSCFECNRSKADRLPTIEEVVRAASWLFIPIWATQEKYPNEYEA